MRPQEDSLDWRELYAADDPSGIPRTAKMLACSVDHLGWARQAPELFPSATLVGYTSDSREQADVLLVRPGGASVWGVRKWLKRQIQSGVYRPTVYCSRGRRRLLRVLTAGVPKDWWVADLTGSPHAVPGAVAVHYARNKYADVSLVCDPSWPHRAPPRDGVQAPVPAPARRPARIPEPISTRLLEDPMQLNHGVHAETAVAITTGATGLRFVAATKADLIVDFGDDYAAHRIAVEFSTGEVDVLLPRDGQSGRPARQAKVIRGSGDIDADVSVAVI
jgi:hypothetical protein